jgi:GLPGLI family protein
MNKLIFLLYFLSLNCIYSQSGSVTYSVKVAKMDKEIPKNIEAFMLKTLDYANNQKFELIFNKTNSSFKTIEQVANSEQFDQKIDNIAKSAFTTSSDIYLDYENKKEVRKESDGLLILYVFNELNWEITKETKLIDGNKCFKATQTSNYIDRKGQPKIKETIAWFAPGLPYNYGPKNFYGLPGLILELTENKTTYLATKIELGKKDILIDFPKGKTITKEEYDKKLKAQLGM